jgi:hypothetical protein
MHQVLQNNTVMSLHVCTMRERKRKKEIFSRGNFMTRCGALTTRKKRSRQAHKGKGKKETKVWMWTIPRNIQKRTHHNPDLEPISNDFGGGLIVIFHSNKKFIGTANTSLPTPSLPLKIPCLKVIRKKGILN